MRRGGFVLVDDCNHDVDGLFARSFESQMAASSGPRRSGNCPTTTSSIGRSSPSRTALPTTGLELNGWGDDLVHDYLKAIEIDGRIAVLYSNKDYGCEWDYDFRNKRFLAEDNTRFGVNIVTYAMTA